MLTEKQIQCSGSQTDHKFIRIFSDQDTWLTVYCDQDQRPIRFTYVQGMRTDVRACLQWSEERGLRFYRIDSGESSPLTNRSPVATETLPFKKEEFITAFQTESREIDPEVRDWIISCIHSH